MDIYEQIQKKIFCMKMMQVFKQIGGKIMQISKRTWFKLMNNNFL